MPSGKPHVAFTTVLAGLVLLQPHTIAPQEDARITLPPESLARAVATNNELLFNIALAERLDINAPAQDGRTPLLVALDQNNRQIVPRLLELGASVDVADANGRTPIMAVAAAGDLELLQVFLPRSQRPDARDARGQSAAHYAAIAGQFAAFETLLPLTRDLSGPAGDGRDLLAIVCETGNAKLIAAVLSRWPGDLDWTPSTRGVLTSALAVNDADLLRLLLAKHRAAPTAEGSNIPLVAHAVVSGDVAMLQALLNAGADPNITLPAPVDKRFAAAVTSNYLRDYVVGDDGVTPLMLAAGMGRLECARVLLDSGADRNRHTTKFKMLALYFAARSKNPKCVQMLLGRGPTREELRVEISLAAQKASIIKNGVPVFNTAVSTGRKGFDTPAGEYVVTDKKRSHKSSIYHVEMPFFMRLNCLDFGLHAGAVPNYPASHGCIRLPKDVAEKIFSEIPVGTMVTIN